MKNPMKVPLAKIFFWLSAMFFVACFSVFVGVWKYKEFRYHFGFVTLLFRDFGSNPHLSKKRFGTKPGFVRYSGFVDHGYLLASAFFVDDGHVEIRLIDLSDGKIVKMWHPDPKEIRRISDYRPFRDVARFEPQSPYLMPDGGLVFIDNQGPLVRIDACSEIVWTVDEHFHHSVERDRHGNFVVPGVEGVFGKPPLDFRNDTIFVVSPKGQVLKRYPIADILTENGYLGLLHTVATMEPNPLHLNDVEVARTTTDNWQAGDWLISLRELNTVAILRPPAMQVEWLRIGPWLKQHDPDFHADGTISIFGNDVDGDPAQFLHGNSEIYVVDPATGDIRTPYSATLKKQQVGTPTEGRERLLPNGDVFIEETDYGRLLRLNAKGLVWSYYNADEDNAGDLNWSRYLPASSLDGIDLSTQCRS